MSSAVGVINYSNDDHEVFIGRDFAQTKGYSEEVAGLIDREVKRIIDECYEKAHKLLMEYKKELEACAVLLLEREKIGRDEFEGLFKDTKIVTEV